MYKKWKSNRFIVTIVILIGIVFSVSAGIMQISGKLNLEKFYDVGNIYEMPFTSHNIIGVNCTYEGETNTHRITDDYAEYNLTLLSPDYSWKYFALELSTLNTQNKDQLPWKLVFCNLAGTQVGETSFYPKKGVQIIPITTEAFSSIHIVIEQQKDVEFSVEKIMLYENQPVFNGKLFAKWFFLYFFIWLIFVLICKKTIWNKLKNVKWYKIVEGLQSIYQFIANRCYEKNGAVLKSYHKQVRKIRTLLFLIMFILMTIVDDTSNYKNEGYNYLLAGCVLLILLIGLISIEKPLTKLEWNNHFVTLWLVFWIMACFSDFIVQKDFHYTGYIMLTVVGLLFFIWHNMNAPLEMIQDMRRALEVSFFLAVLFCLFFRPLDPIMRYMGINNNPIPFAIYLTVVLIAYYARVLETLKDKNWNWKNIVYVFAIVIDIYMVWKTQSTFGILAIGMLTFLFLIWIHILWKRTEKKFIIIYLVAFVICTVPIANMTEWGLMHISDRWGKQIIFINDELNLAVSYQPPLETTVYAADSRVADKLFQSPNLELLTTGRTLYYKVYLREMNLFGHEESATFFNDKHQAHNAMIMIAYRYGVFAVIPYTLMIVLFIYLSWKNLKKKYRSSDAWFLFAVAAVISFMMMCDNLEQPFRWVTWPVYFLSMGYFFTDHKDHKETMVKNGSLV